MFFRAGYIHYRDFLTIGALTGDSKTKAERYCVVLLQSYQDIK